MSLPSIDDWLNLKDWQFELHLEEGDSNKHHWLFSPELAAINIVESIELPSEFCLLMTQYDGDNACYMYDSKPGWMVCGNGCLSPELTKLPTIHDTADYALMVIDKQKNRSELEPLLAGFRDHYGLPSANPNFEAFEKKIEEINPYLYLSYASGKRGDGVFAISRGQKTLASFLKSDAASAIADTSRNQITKHRRLLWRALGPESGPEDCTEKDCTRLRTPVSKKCFLHLNP
ncbi:hypothetical protein BH11CYA1_BH11CYA1_22860 [soil metagenome]